MTRFFRTLAVSLAIVAIATPALAQTAPSAATPGGKKPRFERPKFENIDTNKDGGISLDELKASLAERPRALKRADKMFKRMDKNDDGKIDLNEFKARRGHGHGGRHKKKDGAAPAPNQ